MGEKLLGGEPNFGTMQGLVIDVSNKSAMQDQINTSQNTPKSADTLDKVGPLPIFIIFEPLGDVSQPPVLWRLAGAEPEYSGSGELPAEVTAHELWLFRDEAEGYYLNLESPEPSIFVMWRIQATGYPAALAVTLSYNEAGRLLDAGETVERLSMPDEMKPWLAEFAQAHFQPDVKKKKRGQKPSFMSREEFSKMAEKESLRSKEQ
jgi:Protein of unknown function (DUF3305)